MLTPENLEAIARAHGLVTNQVQAAKPAAIGVVEKLFMTVEAVGSSMLSGYVNGRFASAGKDHLSMFGLPVDATLATLIYFPALFGVFGDNYGIHMASIATGLGCGAGYREMFARGASARVEQEEGKRMLASDSKKGLGEGTQANPQPEAEVIPFFRRTR